MLSLECGLAFSGVELIITVASAHSPDLANPRLKSTRLDLSRLQELEAT